MGVIREVGKIRREEGREKQKEVRKKSLEGGGRRKG
jgi:hypothetical protein